MNKIRRGILYGVYLLFWLLCFELVRVFFIVFNLFNGFSCSIADFFGSLWHGLVLDVSVASYIGIAVVPFFIIFAFVKSNKAFRIFLDAFSAILLLAFSLLVVSDAEIYRSWQFRIDASVLSYLENPQLAFASISAMRLTMLFVLSALLAIGLFLLFKLMTRKMFEKLQPERLFSLLFLLVGAMLVIPARGGVGIVPVNVGSVYFSEKSFGNHSAINIGWNCVSYYFKNNDDFEQYMYFDEDINLPSDTTANSYYGRKVLKNTPEHIVFVILESFTWSAMCYDNPTESVTPKLLSWRNKGIFFSNFYASGDRSVRGIASIFSGVPSLPEYSVMKDPEKSQQLPSLLQTLRENGYENQSFFYGGDINFANMNSYLLQNGVDHIVSQNNLKLDCRQTKWGYDDECMFDRFYCDIQNLESKSVSILFTLNSHEPFDVPIAPFGSDDELSKSMNAYYYTDSCLNDFLVRMQSSRKWEKTLVVLVSDHGKLFRSQNWASLDKSHIMMQWLGGVVNESFVCDLPCDQSDIASSLLSVLDIDTEKFEFSENIFGKNCPTAFSVFGSGMSFVEGGANSWYSIVSDKFSPENVPDDIQRKTKAYCQKTAMYYKSLK